MRDYKSKLAKFKDNYQLLRIYQSSFFIGQLNMIYNIILKNQNYDLKISIINEIIKRIKLSGGFIPLKKRIKLEINETTNLCIYIEALKLHNNDIVAEAVMLSPTSIDFIKECDLLIALKKYDNDLLLRILDNMPYFKHNNVYYIMVNGYFTDDKEEFENMLCKVGEIPESFEDDDDDVNIFFYFDKEQKIVGNEGSIFIYDFEVCV